MDETQEDWTIFNPVEIQPSVMRSTGLDVWVTIPTQGPKGPTIKPIAPNLPGDLRNNKVLSEFNVTDFELRITEAALQASLENVQNEIKRRKTADDN